MPNNERLLFLLQTLQENTDDETWLTTADLRRVLEMEGCECSIRTLRTDIQSMKNCGYEIAVRETEGASTEYAWMDREWSQPELQILVDAVSAAQFIPQKRSEELIRKLAEMAGPSHAKELVPEILISEHIKAKNRNMIYTVQEIRRNNRFRSMREHRRRNTSFPRTPRYGITTGTTWSDGQTKGKKWSCSALTG